MPFPSPHPSGRAFQRQTLARQIAARLSEAIRNGEIVDFLPAERDICTLYRASRPTVRQAIHHLQEEGIVSLQERQRTRILASQPSSAPTAKAPNRAALLLTEGSAELSKWHLAATDEIRQELASQGISLQVIYEPLLHHLHTANPTKRLERLYANIAADHWILGGTSANIQKWFSTRGIRAVSMGNAFPESGLPFVNDDLRGVTRHAAGIFLGQGHRHISYLMRQRRSAGEHDEEAGFLSAFPPDATLKATGHVIRHDGRVSSIRERLQQLLTREPRPTALLISHAEDTLVVYNWLLERGLRLPHDISLISYQWESYLERLMPLPAWYYSNPKEHARKLCRLLLNPAYRPRSPRLILPSFHRNGTLAPPPTKAEA